MKGEDIVALCDVDRNYLNRAATNFPQARLYADYREMIEAEGDRIDAVVVGTTDHHHAPASIRAIRAGKHCYCEKPLTHTVEEARIIAEAAKQHGVATQLGTQIHAEDNYRRVVEIIRAGVIGDVTDVHVWVGKGWGGGDRPATGQEPPEYLNWELWLGPAPIDHMRLGVIIRAMAKMVGFWRWNDRGYGVPLHGLAILGVAVASSFKLCGGGP